MPYVKPGIPRVSAPHAYVQRQAPTGIALRGGAAQANAFKPRSILFGNTATPSVKKGPPKGIIGLPKPSVKKPPKGIIGLPTIPGNTGVFVKHPPIPSKSSIASKKGIVCPPGSYVVNGQCVTPPIYPPYPYPYPDPGYPPPDGGGSGGGGGGDGTSAGGGGGTGNAGPYCDASLNLVLDPTGTKCMCGPGYMVDPNDPTGTNCVPIPADASTPDSILSSIPWWAIAAAGVGVYFVFKKKKKHS